MSESVSIPSVWTDNSKANTSGTLVFTTNSYGPAQVVNVTLEEGRLIVVKKADPQVYLTVSSNWPHSQPQPRMWKEIYEAVGREIKLVKTIEGKWIPPQEGYVDWSE